MRRQGGTGRPFQPTARAAAYRAKAERRQRAKGLRERFYQRFAAWTVQKMAISTEEREWRVLLLTGPDDRTLTGRLMGDPRFPRSALYAKRMGV